jgi:carboxyl-terminal processing protease
LTNNFSLNGYLLKRGLLLSGLVTLLGFSVAMGISWARHTDRAEAAIGAPGTQFSPTVREDLEAAYHRAWIALRQNYADQDKLTDWQGWESKYKGKIRTEHQLVLAVQEMISSLGDKRTTILTASQLLAFEQKQAGKVVGIGVNLNEYKIQSVMKDSPAEKAGLEKDDLILAVDGVPVGGLTTEGMITLIRGPENAPVVLTINHKNDVHDVMVNRALIKQDPAVRSNTWGAYSIRVDNLRSDSVITELDKAFKADQPSVIVDLRGLNGGSGMTAAQVAALFLNTNCVITSATQRRDGEEFKVTYAIRDGKLVQSTTKVGGTTADTIVDTPVGRYAGKVVLLVDDQTTGAAEIITAALKENNRATVVGLKTRGKGTGQVTVALTQKYVMRVTNAHYFSPSGMAIDGNGVTPDLPVDPKERESLFHNALVAAQVQK